jgi:hypothetical protein
VAMRFAERPVHRTSQCNHCTASDFAVLRDCLVHSAVVFLSHCDYLCQTSKNGIDINGKTINSASSISISISNAPCCCRVSTKDTTLCPLAIPYALRYLPSCVDCLPVAVGLREWLPCGLSARCGSRCAQAER